MRKLKERLDSIKKIYDLIPLTKDEQEIWDKNFLSWWNNSKITENNTDLFVELCKAIATRNKLTTFLDKNGYSFSNGGGRNGEQYKKRPEVSMLKDTRKYILDLHKILKLNEINKDYSNEYFPEDDI